MKFKILGLLITMATLPNANAHGQHDPAQFQAALKACESSALNTGGVTFQAPTPGQRPNFTEEQRALLQACEQAGILPKHPHGSPPPQE
jgi:hypothetical protein